MSTPPPRTAFAYDPDMTGHPLAANPVRTLTARLGELKQQADTQIANLTLTLKQLDDTKTILDELGLTMTVDLGPIGNAAANERRKQIAAADEPRGYMQPQHREQAA